MTGYHDDSFDIFTHNRTVWDRQAEQQCEWSRPVSKDIIAAAKGGKWEVHLTPRPLPKEWVGELQGKKVLCLASAGGQQAPVLAAVGACVTVYDASAQQLQQDRMVAERDGLELITMQGDMRNLSVFSDGHFDLIFNPISNLYIPDVLPLWQECYRVLRPGGVLLASFYNPVVFIGDRDPKLMQDGLMRPCHKLPYSDLKDLDRAGLEKKRQSGDALVFGHSLTDLIGGQIETGFMISGFLEDDQPNTRFLIDQFMPTFIATRAIKV